MSILSRNPPDFKTSDRMDKEHERDCKVAWLMAQPSCPKCERPMPVCNCEPEEEE